MLRRSRRTRDVQAHVEPLRALREDRPSPVLGHLAEALRCTAGKHGGFLERLAYEDEVATCDRQLGRVGKPEAIERSGGSGEIKKRFHARPCRCFAPLRLGAAAMLAAHLMAAPVQRLPADVSPAFKKGPGVSLGMSDDHDIVPCPALKREVDQTFLEGAAHNFWISLHHSLGDLSAVNGLRKGYVVVDGMVGPRDGEASASGFWSLFGHGWRSSLLYAWPGRSVL